MKKNNPKVKNSQRMNLSKIKIPLIIIILLFFFSILFGYINSSFLSPFILPILEEIVDKTENLTGIGLFFFIFLNNALTSLSAMALGLLLGIFPLIVTLSNGVILGFVLERTAHLAGFHEWWRILPHGIFELPAIFISLALGLKLGISPLINYISHYKKNNLSMIIIPLLIALLLAILSILTVSSNPQLNSSLLASQGLQAEHFNPAYSYILTAIAQSIIFLILIIVIFIVITSLTNKELGLIQTKTMKENIINSLKIFFFLVIPLLFLAAIIETLLILFV